MNEAYRRAMGWWWTRSSRRDDGYPCGLKARIAVAVALGSSSIAAVASTEIVISSEPYADPGSVWRTWLSLVSGGTLCMSLLIWPLLMFRWDHRIGRTVLYCLGVVGLSALDVALFILLYSTIAMAAAMPRVLVNNATQSSHTLTTIWTTWSTWGGIIPLVGMYVGAVMARIVCLLSVRRSLPSALCAKCDYPLQSSVCSECGSTVEDGLPKRRAMTSRSSSTTG